MQRGGRVVDVKKGSNHHALREVTLPRLPEAFEDPRPVLVTGIIAWAAAAVFFGITRGWGSELVVTSLIGMVTGLLGFGVYAWQRFAVSRGAQWVQDGITVETAPSETSTAHGTSSPAAEETNGPLPQHGESC